MICLIISINETNYLKIFMVLLPVSFEQENRKKHPRYRYFKRNL